MVTWGNVILRKNFSNINSRLDKKKNQRKWELISSYVFGKWTPDGSYL